MSLVQDDRVIRAGAANTPDAPLDVGIPFRLTPGQLWSTDTPSDTRLAGACGVDLARAPPGH
jgi:hypothetical protein